MLKTDRTETLRRVPSPLQTTVCRVHHTIFHRVTLLSWNYDLRPSVLVENLLRRKGSWQGKVEITQGTKA